MKIASAVGATILLAGLSGCGGSDDSGDDDAAALFIDYADAQDGGYRSVDADIIGSTAGPTCGYADIPTLREVKDSVRSEGGRVTISDIDQFCTESPDYSTCLSRAGGSLVVDSLYEGSPDTREFQIVIPGLGNGKRAYFNIQASGSAGIATASIETPDNSIPPNGNCQATNTIQAPETINGAWLGYKVAYNAGTFSGIETQVTMACSAQNCTISKSSFGAIPFSSFNPAGAWRASFTGYIAGAVVSPDDNALSVYVCTAPLVNATAQTQCSLFGFFRA